MDRRAFLVLSSSALLAHQLDGAQEGRHRLESVGLQLYTVREEMEHSFERTLSRVAEIGYREVEFAGYFDHSPKTVRSVLDQYGLAAPAAHFDYSQFRSELPKLLELAQVIGHQYLICSDVDEEGKFSPDDWKRVAETFNQAGKTCRESGIQFAYHNHDLEFAPVQGKRPYDILLSGTDPSLVRLELDLYWITKAGQDPLAYFAKYSGRFPLVHVKDMDRTPQRGQTEVGKGIIDFKRIFQQADNAGIRHFFVEHDEPTSPFESIRASFEYLKQLRF